MTTVAQFSIVPEDVTQGLNDGYYRGETNGQTCENNWGGHQNRIVVDTSGNVRCLYLTLNTSNGVTSWKLMKRSIPNTNFGVGTWSIEATGTTFDDVDVFLDPRDQTCYVTAWPNGTLSIYSSRDNYQSAYAVPGNWESLPAVSRHYGGVGISPDGTIAFKASRELTYITYPTDSTNTEYTTIKYNTATAQWSNTPYVKKYIGNRYAYDYIWCDPYPLNQGNVIYGSPLWDAYYLACGYPGVGGGYEFPGYKFWSSLPQDDSAWFEFNDQLRDPNHLTAVADPSMYPFDAYRDSFGRTFIILYCAGDGSSTLTANSRVQGMYLVVFDQSRRKIYDKIMPAINGYGFPRLLEDYNHNLYMFWLNQGATAPACTLHTITQLSNPASPTINTNFTVNGSTGSGFTDLSSTIYPYAPENRCSVICRPRNGSQLLSNYVDMELRFYNTLNNGGSYNTSNAAAYANGPQRVMYAQLQLS